MIRIFITVVLFIHCLTILAQQPTDSIATCPIKSIPDLFRKEVPQNIDPKQKDSFFLLIPLIASQPATGFAFGAIGQYTFKGKYEGARYSTTTFSASYTTKKQVIINAKNNLLIKNKFYFMGDWRFYIFSQNNYGLGSDIIPPPYRDSGFDINSLAQPMEYKYLKFHQTVSFLMAKNFFIGGGIHIDGYSDIDDQSLDLNTNTLTSHYIYSQKHGFSSNEYFVNGISLNMVYDSRDDQINANHGWYGNINFRTNPALNKYQSASSVLYTEYSYYFPLSKTNKQHVLAFWTYGQFLMGGNLPYLNLPAIGWDQSSRGGKGYTQGLFRGQNLAYFETEYRFPITCNQLISGTAFANFTSASDKDRDIKLFQYIQPAVGLGLRILIDKASRTNLIFNYAWGRHSEGFYLNAGETF